MDDTVEGFIIAMITAAAGLVACLLIGLAAAVAWDGLHDEQACYDARNLLTVHDDCLQRPDCHATTKDFVFADQARRILARCDSYAQESRSERGLRNGHTHG